MRIKCRTNFDITATGVTGHYRSSRIPFEDRAGFKVVDEYTWNRSRNQQRNWETITQIIALRTQVDITQPIKDNNSWSFEFEFEIASIFDDGTDPLGTLKADCTGVPMLVGLQEVDDPGVILQPEENVWFEIIE